jgi:energy-coupling factor transporter ATP-binding protein EcfA2
VARVVPRETRSADRILADDAEAFRLTARPLKRVVVRNFRALRNVSLNFGEPGSERAPWLMLLGENATGKSTVLQAIALALAGTEEASRHARPAGMLSVGTFEGFVMVWFWDQEAPVELHFRRGEQGLRGTPGASAIVLAYGALRHAERRTRAFDSGPRFSRIAPIMEPIARVPYPGRWLLGLDPTRFDTAARAMRSILPVGPDSVMLRSGNSVFFDVGGHRATLAQLSAGYQTIVGMCADIMRHLFERWDTLASAPGIVLIDEIDAHLHPQWTMRIVGALREAFPQVQFVASTHDPLALRGLRNGEVALLRREPDGAVVADQDLPPLEGMPVEQLLTSRVFGLASTVDPTTESLLDEYYHLRSLPPDPTRDDRMERIRGRVADLEALGRSESEQLMLQATSEFVQAATAEAAAAPPLREETLKALREIADRGAIRRRRS